MKALVTAEWVESSYKVYSIAKISLQCMLSRGRQFHRPRKGGMKKNEPGIPVHSLRLAYPGKHFFLEEYKLGENFNGVPATWSRGKCIFQNSRSLFSHCPGIIFLPYFFLDMNENTHHLTQSSPNFSANS